MNDTPAQYRTQDIEDVIVCHRVNSALAQIRAGDFGRIAATVENAISDVAYEMADARERREYAESYQRGVVLASQFVLASYGDFVELSDAKERWFRERFKINGPVLWRYAGYVATSQRYAAYGLRPRRLANPVVQ